MTRCMVCASNNAPTEKRHHYGDSIDVRQKVVRLHMKHNRDWLQLSAFRTSTRKRPLSLSDSSPEIANTQIEV